MPHRSILWLLTALLGIVFTAGYILGSVYGGMSSWAFGIGPQGIGVVGMALNFAITLGLTPFFPAPDRTVQQLILSIREPEGAPPALDIDRSAEAGLNFSSTFISEIPISDVIRPMTMVRIGSAIASVRAAA